MKLPSEDEVSGAVTPQWWRTGYGWGILNIRMAVASTELQSKEKRGPTTHFMEKLPKILFLPMSMCMDTHRRQKIIFLPMRMCMDTRRCQKNALDLLKLELQGLRADDVGTGNQTPNLSKNSKIINPQATSPAPSYWDNFYYLKNNTKQKTPTNLKRSSWLKNEKY